VTEIQYIWQTERSLKMETKQQKAVKDITSILNGFTASEIQEVLFSVNEECSANYVLVLDEKVASGDSCLS
jgi:hypothetical protein